MLKSFLFEFLKKPKEVFFGSRLLNLVLSNTATMRERLYTFLVCVSLFCINCLAQSNLVYLRSYKTGAGKYLRYYTKYNGLTIPISIRSAPAAQWRNKNPYIDDFTVEYDTEKDTARLLPSAPLFSAKIDSSNLVEAAGRIILVTNHFCVYQFAFAENPDSIISGRQAIDASMRKKYGIVPGATFKVLYYKPYREVSIIYFEKRSRDHLVNYKKPFLSVPNGLSMDIGASQFYFNSPRTDQFLAAYDQPAITNKTAFEITFNFYTRSGLWLGFGFGGNDGFFSGRLFGAGYMQPINRRLYANYSLYWGGMDYRIKPFIMAPLYNTDYISWFRYTQWVLDAKFELMWRLTRNNVWGCKFLKVGAGLCWRPNTDKNWVYDYNESYVSNGKTYTKASGTKDLNGIPALSAFTPYVTLSYTLFHFSRQQLHR